MTDCEKYKHFVEDNYMFEFMIWEEHIMNLDLFNPANNKKNDNGIIDIDSTTI